MDGRSVSPSKGYPRISAGCDIPMDGVSCDVNTSYTLELDTSNSYGHPSMTASYQTLPGLTLFRKIVLSLNVVALVTAFQK